jgi:hypothetical protein
MAKTTPPEPPEEDGEETELPLGEAVIGFFQQWEEKGLPVVVVIDSEDNEQFIGLLANCAKQLKRIADAGEAIFGVGKQIHDRLYNRPGGKPKDS